MHAKDALHQLAAPSAHQPADSQNFTAADGQAHALDLVVGPDDVFCLKDDLADVRLQLWIHIRDLPSHHHFNELAFVQLRCGACPDVLSIPVDADPVADGKDLRHAMGDVDDGNALLLQAADMSKQQLHFPVGAVGSSMMITLALTEIALMISMSWHWATVRFRSVSLGETCRPHSSISF